MSANITATLESWSTTAASNQPDGTDTSDIDAEFRQVQAVIRAYLASIGSNIASGTTVDLATSTGLAHTITHSTGTTAIGSFGTLAAGMWKILIFSVSGGTLTITHNATSMICPGGTNITCNDQTVLTVLSLGSGNWRILPFAPASGFPAASSGKVIGWDADGNLVNLDPIESQVALSTTKYTATGAENGVVPLDFTYTLGANSLLVMKNGYVQIPSDNYTESDVDEITMVEDLQADEVVYVIGNTHASTFTPQQAALAAIAALTPAADKLPYYTSTTAAALATLTSFARTLLDDTTAANARTTLDVYSTSEIDALVGGGSLGVGQSWQDVKASRAMNTSYQNTTDAPIQVFVNVSGGSGAPFYASTDNSTWVLVMNDGGNSQTHGVIIPSGHYYKVVSSGSVSSWAELR